MIRAFPVIGLIAAIIGGGLFLQAIVARSPHTHDNLAVYASPGYTRTGVIFVGSEEPYTGFAATSSLNASADLVERGASLLVTNGCVICHGLTGQGGPVGPSIAGLESKDLKRRMEQGPGGMPVYPAARLAEADLAALAAFLQTQPTVVPTATAAGAAAPASEASATAVVPTVVARPAATVPRAGLVAPAATPLPTVAATTAPTSAATAPAPAVATAAPTTASEDSVATRAPSRALPTEAPAPTAVPSAPTAPAPAAPTVAAAPTADAPPAEATLPQKVQLEMYDWGFKPTEITVARGEIELTIGNAGRRTHGILIEALKVDDDARPRRKRTIRFQVDEPGRYQILCNDDECGTDAQHESMQAFLVVE